MKIILEMHDQKYMFESSQDDFSANEVKEIFSRLLVQATYPPDVIDLAEGGHFKCEYVQDQ